MWTTPVLNSFTFLLKELGLSFRIGHVVSIKNIPAASGDVVFSNFSAIIHIIIHVMLIKQAFTEHCSSRFWVDIDLC